MSLDLLARRFLQLTIDGILNETITLEERRLVTSFLYPPAELWKPHVSAAEFPATLKGGERKADSDLTFIEFDLPTPADCDGGRRLAASPKGKRDEWLSSNVCADCGFVVKMSARQKPTLDVSIYVKPRLRRNLVLSMEFIETKKCPAVERHIGVDMFRPVDPVILNDEQKRRVSLALTDGETAPEYARITLELPNNALKAKRARLSLRPDENGNQHSGNSASFSGNDDLEVIRSASRRPFDLGLSPNEETKIGFLLSEEQRNTTINSLHEKPWMKSAWDINPESVADAGKRALDALKAGTFCSLVSDDDRAVQSYFSKIARNAQIDALHLAGRASDDDADSKISKTPSLHQIPSRSPASSRGELFNLIENSMRLANLSTYAEFLDRVEELLLLYIETEWHKELIHDLLHNRSTIEDAATRQGQKGETARAFFSRLLSKLQNQDFGI